MNQIYQLLSKRNHKTVGEFHIIQLLFAGSHMSRVKASLIDKILRGQAIAVFLLKPLQSPGAYGEVIGAPVCEMVSMAFILSPDPNEVVEKRGKTYHRGIRIFPAPVFQPGKQIFLRIRVTGINGHQMLLIPVICNMIIHIDLFPDPICQEIHRIIVICPDSCNLHSALRLIKGPLLSGNLCIVRAVKHLPEFQRIL